MKRSNRVGAFLLVCCLGLIQGSVLWGADEAVSSAGARFDLEALSKTPEVFDAPELQAEGVKAFFYAG